MYAMTAGQLVASQTTSSIGGNWGLYWAGILFTYLLTCPSIVLTRLMGSCGVSVTVAGAAAAAAAAAVGSAMADPTFDGITVLTVLTVAVEIGTEKSKTTGLEAA